MNLLSFFNKLTFSQGIHPAYHKSESAKHPIKRLPFPPQLIVPLSQHIGNPAKLLVKKGQEVLRGQILAEADGIFSVPIHAPATGIIKSIMLMPSAAGPKVKSIIIDVYGGSSQQVMYENPNDLDSMNNDDIISAVQNIGLAGLGGAAFPSHIKLMPPQEHSVDTLVVNGCECEPYLTTDHRVMLEHPQHLINGIKIALKVTGAKKAIIGIEDNKKDAAEAIKQTLKADDPIEVKLVETKYPQGSEKMLIKSLLNKEVPAGGIPAQIGVVVNNVGTLSAMGKLLPSGEGLIERVVTVTGSGIKKPGNYIIPIGTPIRFVLESLGIEAGHNDVILGGPMMGMSIASLDVPVIKGTSGILVFHERSQTVNKLSAAMPCIKCGRCVDACPMHLNPQWLGTLAQAREYLTMEQEFNLNDCFECGCCSYSCPANIPLVQYFKISKSLNRQYHIDQRKKEKEEHDKQMEKMN